MSWADLLDETIAVLQDNTSKSKSESPDDDLKTNNNILYVAKKNSSFNLLCFFSQIWFTNNEPFG